MPDYEEELPPLEYVNAKGVFDAWMFTARMVVFLAIMFFLGWWVLFK